MLTRTTLFAFLAVWMGAFGASACAPLPAATDPVMLSVSGEISCTNAGDQARFDAAMLRALDWKVIETYTKWTEGPQTFSGPTLASLLASVGATGARLKAQALNDYAVELPTQDIDSYTVLLAIEHDGKPMRVRDKGPIWIIYRMGTQNAALHAAVNSRMIWQLVRLEVLP